METQIRLKHIQITDLRLEIGTFNKDITKKLTTGIEIGSRFSDENDRAFAIVFMIELKNKKKFSLNLEATAHFEANCIVDEDFKSAPFIKINAPAIAFPYIRTYISNLTLNSGYNPVMLPSFNFIKIAEEQEK
jgi:preprotein translocase subunit SecB